MLKTKYVYSKITYYKNRFKDTKLNIKIKQDD